MIFRKTGHKCCFQIIYSCARSIAYLFLNIYDHLSFALILMMVMFIYSRGVPGSGRRDVLQSFQLPF